jgi:Ca-activated chloride channel family protein
VAGKTNLMTLQFQYPWVLFLLWIVPVIGLAWHLLAKQQISGRAFVSPFMAAKLAPLPSPARRTWQLAFLMAGLLMTLVAIARPQWGMKDETVYQRGRDLLVVLDVSRSMLATDVHPSRLGRAKVDLLDLIRQLHGDRVGLLAFRGRPLLLCPLTTDYGFLSQTLEGTGVDSAPAGETDIGDAIQEALRNFQGDEGSHKAIVLISDGDDLAGKTAEAAAKAKEQGVAIFTVGFGSTEGAPVPSASNKKETMSFQGQAVISKLNHEILRDIAEKTGGAYVPVGLANVKLGDLYRNHLSRITAHDLEESVQRRTVERYQWFLFPAVLCFLTIAFFSRGQIALKRKTNIEQSTSNSQHRTTKATLPSIQHSLLNVGCLMFILLPASLFSQTNTSVSVPPGREGARLAQKLYLLGKYEESAAAYQSAAQTAASTTRDDYLFNAGCSFLKAGKAGDAADVFRSMTGVDGERGSLAAYNLGCALFADAAAPKQNSRQPDPSSLEKRTKAYEQAGIAFQRAVYQGLDDPDTRKNLAVVAGLVPAAREEAKIARLMAEHGQAQPGALADTMLIQQRNLLKTIPAAFTNTTPALISELEARATEQDHTADLMIPLKGKLLQAISQSQTSGNNTNAPQQLAQVNAFAEAIRDQLFGVASALRDLDRSAAPSAVQAESSIYTLWKGIAGYQQLLREDIERQTNAITLTTPNLMSPSESQRKTIGDEQSEALALTGLFKERFEQTVPPEGISRPVQQTSTNETAGTNATEVILSAEDRAKIVSLTGQAVTTQTSARESVATNLNASLTHQRKAYALLKEIEKLLPKEKQPQDSSQQQQQDQKDTQQQKEQPQEQPKEQPKEQKQPEKQEPKKGEMSQEDLKRMLEKAKQREQEHEQEKRERNNSVPMSPAERDW